MLLSVTLADPETLELGMVLDLQLAFLLGLVYSAGIHHHVVIVLDARLRLQR